MLKSIRWREVFSAGVWMCALWVALFYISLPSVAVVAALVGGIGYGVGGALGFSRVRLLPLLAAAALAALAVLAASSALCDSWGLASSLGAARAWSLSQCLFWAGEGALLAGTLRLVSGRFPAAITAEMVTVVLLLASPLASHRQGAINRPQFLVDPLWAANIDPVPVLFALGALAAAFLVILQNGRRTRRASVLDLLLLFVLIGGIYAFLPARKLMDSPLKDPGSQSQKDKDKKERERRERARDGKGGPPPPMQSEAEEMPLDKPEQQDKPKQRPVAVVLLSDDYDPPQGGFYFRQTAFSQYNGLRLVADTTGRSDVDLLTDYPTASATAIPSTVPESSPFHKRVHTFTAMVEAHTKPFTLVDGRSAQAEENPNSNQFVRAYGADSLAMSVPYTDLFETKAGDPKWSPEVWRHYTEYPADPRYKQLAEECAARLPEKYRNSDFARAVACKLYLDKTMTYTTRAHHGGKDPVADYLFGNHLGYCVHQAHAAVYLFRALGLPARVGAGYYSDARNRGNGSAVLLRSGDAHAWPEVYLQGAGWTILDISPAKSLDHEVEKPDPDLQRLLGELARKKKGLPKGDPGAGPPFDFQAWALWLFWGGLSSLGVALVGSVVGVYVYKYYRRFEPLWASAERMPIAALRSALDQLAEVGVRRRYGEGRLEFARRAGVEALEPLTDRHLEVSLTRGRSASSKELLQLREAVHHHIAKQVPLWRRVLGFLHPLSWWDAK